MYKDSFTGTCILSDYIIFIAVKSEEIKKLLMALTFFEICF